MIKARQVIQSIQETLTVSILDPWLDHLKTKHPLVVGKRHIIDWIDTQLRDYFLHDYGPTHTTTDLELEANKVFSYLGSEDAPHNIDDLSYQDALDRAQDWMKKVQGEMRAQSKKIVGGDLIDMFVLLIEGDPRIKENKRAREWVRANLRNYLYRDIPGLEEIDAEDVYSMPYPDWAVVAVENGETVYQLIPSYETQEALKELELDINLVVDYLNSEESPRNPVTMSIPDAIDKAKQWAKHARTQVEAQAAIDGTIVVMEFPDGFKWRQIRTGEALEIEGRVMELECAHTYADRIENRSYQLYSLRDPQNRPRGIILIHSGGVAELKGRGNGPVRRTYYQYFYDFLNDFPGGLPDPIKELHNINGVIRNDTVVGRHNESFFESLFWRNDFA